MTGLSVAPPLARLFAMAFRDLVDDLHARLATRGWEGVRPPYGFVLLAARERATTGTELAALMGVSKQAASKLIETMTGDGLVRLVPGVQDSRRRLVVLTPRGEELLEAVEGIYRDLEEEWAQVIGGEAVERVRRDVTAVLLDRHDGRLPPVRPGW